MLSAQTKSHCMLYLLWPAEYARMRVCVFVGRVVCHCLWQFPEFAVRRLHCSRSLSPPKYSKNKNKSKNNKGTTNNNYNITGAAKACGTKWNGMKDWNRRRYFFRFFLFFIRFGFLPILFVCGWNWEGEWGGLIKGGGGVVLNSTGIF